MSSLSFPTAQGPSHTKSTKFWDFYPRSLSLTHIFFQDNAFFQPTLSILPQAERHVYSGFE